MIARTWQGWTAADAADDFQHFFETEVVTHLKQSPGFRGAHLLRRQDGDEVAFTSVTFFAGMDDVRMFAGDHPELAHVEDTGRRSLTHWDDHIAHHDVAVDLPQ